MGELPFDYVLVNSHLVALPVAWGVTQVGPEAAAEGYGVPVVAVDVLDLSRPTRHDPRQLAERLLALYQHSRPPRFARRNGNGRLAV